MLRRTGAWAGLRYALTDRLGGTSAAPFDALNLGDHVGDDPASVEANRAALLAALPGAAALAFMRQVHGAQVAVVPVAGAPPAGGSGSAGVLPQADALVTAEPGLALVVLTADCVPVLLGAPDRSVVAAVHAGRQGVTAGVVTAAVSAMAGLGVRPEQVAALVGPSVCGACYEVPAEMAAAVCAEVPAARAASRAGTPALDLRAAVVAQLGAAGVERVEVDPACTLESPELFSHRRDRVTGRIAGVVWIPA